jgi:hypothetical protein
MLLYVLKISAKLACMLAVVSAVTGMERTLGMQSSVEQKRQCGTARVILAMS